MDLALDLTRQGPLTILGDLVHNPDVVAHMDAAGAVRAHRREDMRTRGGAADGPRHRRPRQAAAAPAGARGPRRHLSAGEAGASGAAQSWSPRAGTRSSSASPSTSRSAAWSATWTTTPSSRTRATWTTGRQLAQDPSARLGVVAQTTQPLERVRELVAAHAAAVPAADVRFIDTVCQPTKDRQQALRQLAADSEWSWWSAARTATTAAN